MLRYRVVKGLTNYLDADAIQEALVRAALDCKKNGLPTQHHLLAYEMHPVYTGGRRERGSLTSEQISHIRWDGRADYVETLRGGQTTFHGPGQLVAYPIVDLKPLGLTARCYVHRLEQALIQTLAAYGIEGFRTENTGVWVSQEAKVAALGIHVRRSITSHGVALNVHTDPVWFDRIVACGLPDKKTVSMNLLVDRKLTVAEVGDRFAQELGQVLGLEVVE